LLLARHSVSAVGDRLAPVALAFAVLDLTGSVTDLGIVLAAQTVPLVALVLLGGVWADRLEPRRMMIVADVIRAGAQATCAVLLLQGVAQVWELAAVQAVWGAATALGGPARASIVSRTVAAGDLQQANALVELATNLAAVLGPALAGAIVVALSPGWGLAVDAATFAVSVVLLRAMALEALPAPERTGTLAELRAGWRAFSSRAWVWASTAFFTLYIGLVYGPWQVLGPEVAKTSLGGAGAWAAITAAMGLGALLGAVVGLRWRPRYPLRVAFVWFLLVGPALIALVAAHAPLGVIIGVALLEGSTGTVFNLLWYTALQREIPPGELSRVISWDYIGVLALQPLGQAAAGPVAAGLGVSATLYGSAALFAVLALAVLAIPAVRNFAAA
jgi:predicted MFS family arabinose efflux permease